VYRRYTDNSLNFKKVPKQKLTLALNGEVIEKAKAAGINISSVTEQILKTMTFEPKGNTKKDLIKSYTMLFESIKPVLDRYDAEMVVGKQPGGSEDRFDEDGNKLPGSTIYVGFEIRLNSNYLFVIVEAEDEIVRTSIAAEIHHLYSPIKILENLILALIEAAQKNKEKFRELEFALRFIKALSNEEENKIDNSERRVSE
jgi:hypothetical protein